MRPLIRILLVGGLSCWSVSWAGGGIIGGGPAKLQQFRPEALVGAIRMEGQVKGVRWTGRTGRSVTTTLPAPLALDALDGIPCPAGEWVELTLILEDGVVLRGGEAVIHQPTGALSLVLAEPIVGGGAATLTLDLPEDPGWLSSSAREVPLEDVLLVAVTVTRPW